MLIPADILERTLESVRRFVLENLPYDKNDARVVSYLSALDASDILTTWFNWTWRMVTVHPRRVHVSQELPENPLCKKYRPALGRIIADIQNGAELRKYLSRSVVHVVDPSWNPKRRGRKRHLDLMLNGWGIYHLHMGDTLEADGFVKRSKHLLFVIFRRGHAFLLDIMPHDGAWAQERTIRIILRNWPEAGFVQKMEGVIGLSRSITDEERGDLMRNHVNSPVEIDGGVYLPSSGIMASGIPMGALENADKVMISIEEFIERVRFDTAYLRGMLESRGIALPEEINFQFVSDETGFGLIETGSTTFFQLFDARASE